MKKKILYLILGVSLCLNLAIGIVYSKKQLDVNSRNYIITDNKDAKDIYKELKYGDGFSFEVKGKYHKDKNFHRLPAKYEKIVRPEVWRLSKNSSGISIRFVTNSTTISAKWKLTDNSSFPNMSDIGANGLDLYCFINGSWQYVKSAIPTGLTNESLLISDMDTTSKIFSINLPLYNGIENIQIGINKKSLIYSPIDDNIDKIKRPIVFYGTSITQGAGASRPGMAYPSIISRKLNIEVINLGFSGNGKFETIIGQALCDIDAGLIVIDCTPNSPPGVIKSNALKLIQQIRKCKPTTPILLVESIIREYSCFVQKDSFTFGGLPYIRAQNQELKQSFNSAEKAGIKDIYYLAGDDLIGTDHEGTVDGTHLSDLGSYRIANMIEAKIREILNYHK